MNFIRQHVLLPMLLLTLFGSNSYSQSTYKEFFPDEYPASSYNVKFANFYLDSIKIKVIEVKNKKMDDEGDTFCRAWLKIIKNDSVINQVFFDNMDSVARSCVGFFFPSPQPSPEYFMAVKYGDFSGRTIVVDKRGKLFDIIGGEYFITRDNRFLFSVFTSNTSGIAVFDFITDKVVYLNDTISTSLSEWYFQDGRYFSMDQEAEDDESETEAELMNYALLQFPIRYFDPLSKQLKKDKLTFANLREDTRIKLEPFIKKQQNCLCK